MRIIFIFCLGLFSFKSKASPTEVVFLEVKNEKGQTVFLEPDFPYAHVVLSWKGSYIHSHPRTGVTQLTKEQLDLFGIPRERFLVPEGSLSEEVLELALGKGYDSYFSWSDERFYCSELVAKAIGFLPEPMHFDPKLWPPHFQDFEGLPGISPGKIYQKLKAGAFLFE